MQCFLPKILSFFLIVIEWNKIIANVRNSARCNVFKKVSEGLKFLTRVRFGLKHLADPKLSRNFQYRVNSICICSQETKVLTPFLLHCSNYHCERQNLFSKKKKFDSTILKQNLKCSFACFTDSSTIFVTFFSIFIITSIC